MPRCINLLVLHPQWNDCTSLQERYAPNTIGVEKLGRQMIWSNQNLG